MSLISQIKEQVDRLKNKGVTTQVKDASGVMKPFIVNIGTPRFLRTYRRQLVALTHKRLDTQGVKRHKDGNKLGLRKRLEGEDLR